MTRHTRYQGAIVRDHQMLLLRHREHASGRSYWVIPGGGIEANESEADCVRREMREETNLEVQVERLLLDDAAQQSGMYERYKTYLCTILSGDAQPGYEPEPEASALYAIDQLTWVDLRDQASWSAEVKADPYTYPSLLRVCAALGYE